MAGDQRIFSSLNTLSSNTCVTLVDCSSSNVAGIGVAHPNHPRPFESSLYVPKFPLSLSFVI